MVARNSTRNAQGTTSQGNEADMALMPWSHRQSTLIKALVTIAAGAGSGLIGTMAHRMGASMNIPYGLVLAFLILGMSTWCARSRMGTTGLALHLIVSSLVAWQMALPGPGGDALTPIGFGSPMPFFSEHAGYIWLFGLIVVQVLMLVLPRRWFAMPPRRPYAAVDAELDAAGVGDRTVGVSTEDNASDKER